MALVLVPAAVVLVALVALDLAPAASLSCDRASRSAPSDGDYPPPPVDHRQQRVAGELKALALALPGAFEDHPWGDTVVKVNKKVFVFLGGDGPEDRLSLSVKLPESAAEALTMPFTAPTGYGLGRSGWVTARFESGEAVPAEILGDWIDESYRAVAPKKLVAELDARRS